LGGAGAAASGIGYLPGAPLGTNLKHFVAFTLVTSTTSWDTVRAITCVLALVVLGGPVLALLRRAGARAAFGSTPQFSPVADAAPRVERQGPKQGRHPAALPGASGPP
jgi:hypothetical protein